MEPSVEQLERSNPRLCEIVKHSGFERLIKCSGTLYRLKPVRTRKGNTFSIQRES